jgi:hypothetical protein
MNTSDSFDTAPVGQTLVGLALTSAVAGQYTLIAGNLLSAWVTAALECVNAGPSEAAFFCAPFFMGVTVKVLDRNSAVRELRRLLEPTNWTRWTLAFFCEAEGIWRSYARAEAPEFGQLQRREALEAARDYMWAETTKILSACAAMARESEGQGPMPDRSIEAP